MAVREPATELDARFSSPQATGVGWSDGRRRIEEAPVFWLSTVRPDGRPHVTPLIAVWVDDTLYFCTGADERKAKNLARNANCILTTGCNDLDRGLDVVIEGAAQQVSDEPKLQQVADRYVSKYGNDWRFDVRDGAFHGQGETPALVFEVVPSKVLGFRKGDEFSQTRWSFNPER